MNERINAGTLLAAIGAVVLFVSLFLDWYEPGLSAWTTFELVDIVLAVIAALVLLTAVTEMTGMRLDLDADRLLTFAGIASLLLVVISIVNNPPAAHGLDKAVGAWIGLTGAILIGIGGFLAQRRISIQISTSPRTDSSEEATRPDNPVGRD